VRDHNGQQLAYIYYGIAVTSLCGKPKRKDMRALFCAAHLVLNTLFDEFGALVEW
jgi:hypothetical protein